MNGRVIFSIDSVIERLNTAKLSGNNPWWSGVLTIKWDEVRDGNHGTKWIPIYFTDKTGVTARLITRINGEKHSGYIMPNTQEGLNEMTKMINNPKYDLKLRGTTKPSIHFTKYNAKVDTEADGLTVKKDIEGNPIYPDDDKKSKYFTAANLINDAINEEIEIKIKNGLKIIKLVKACKKKASSFEEEFNKITKSLNITRKGDIIIASKDFLDIDDKTIAKKIDRYMIMATTIKISSMTQTRIGQSAKVNAGKAIPNPIARVTIPLSSEGKVDCPIYDKDKPYTSNNTTKYELAKVDGKVVDANNIHLFFLPRTSIDAIVSIDAICLSSLAISVSTKALLIVAQQAASNTIDIDQLYDYCSAPVPEVKNEVNLIGLANNNNINNNNLNLNLNELSKKMDKTNIDEDEDEEED
jgi:hypothetical protein